MEIVTLDSEMYEARTLTVVSAIHSVPFSWPVLAILII